MNSCKNNIVCILNFPSHYRKNIYLQMEETLGCDFYFGNEDDTRIRKMDLNEFKNSAQQLRTIKFGKKFNWIKGTVPLVFKKYDTYLLTGAPYCLSNWVILLWCRLLNKKSFVWSHGLYGNEGPIRKFIKKTFFKLSHGVFLYGNYAKDLMLREGFDAKTLHVIFNSLDYDTQLGFRNRCKPISVYSDYFKNQNPNLLFVGRLTKVKRLDFLIETIKEVKKNGTNFNVIFIGDGPEKLDLMSLAKKLGVIDNCWFYGATYNEEELCELLHNADVCVSPGNVGLTAIHALMYGLPVITHNNWANQMPEFEAIINKETGGFFKENNVASLAETIEEWIKENKNREVVRLACYKRIDSYYNPSYQISILKKVLC